MPPPPPALALPAEILEEIFLRLPPDEPACLVRASLISKPWLSLLPGPSFQGRYREFHGATPMLGFVYSWPRSVPTLVSTSKFGARIPEDKEADVLDCRHGRVLLLKKSVARTTLVVWDPMTGSRKELHAPEDYNYYVQMAAVLCAVAGCDHRACHDGPFRVVLFALEMSHGDCVAKVYMSLPEVGEWSNQCSDLHLVAERKHPFYCLDLRTEFIFIQPMTPVLVEATLYFMLWKDDDYDMEIFEYDMGSNFLSRLDVSLAGFDEEVDNTPILMAMKDGSLGLAYQDGLTINVWLRPTRSNGVLTWNQCGIIDLKKVRAMQNPKIELSLIGYVEHRDIIFVNTKFGIYEINLKSLRVKKIGKIENLCTMIPYMSFYDPRERVISSDAP